MPVQRPKPRVGAIVLGVVGPLAFLGLTLFAISNFAYQAALIYYDSTLPVVSKPESRGRVSVVTTVSATGLPAGPVTVRRSSRTVMESGSPAYARPPIHAGRVLGLPVVET